jgi:hypothetical protein
MPRIKKEGETRARALAQASSEFAWNNCGGQDLRTRVSLKQQAVDDAFGHAHQIRDQLKEGIERVRPDHTTAFDLMGGHEIRSWMEEMGEY